MPKFKPGQSGNPAGRPRGALNKTTLMAKALVEGQAEAILDRAIKNVLLGFNPQILKLLVQWLLPQGREEVPHDIEARIEDLERRIDVLEMQRDL